MSFELTFTAPFTANGLEVRPGYWCISPIYNYISGVIHFRQWQVGLMDWLPRLLTELVLFFKVLQNDEP